MDWLLALLFTIVLAVLGNSLMPGPGSLLGVIVALGLLFLAKRRRDSMQKPTDEK